MAAYSDWRSRLNNQQFCKQLRENNCKDTRHKVSSGAKQLLAVYDGDLYVWDSFSAHLLYFNLKTLLNGETENNTVRHQTLLCTNAPKYEVEGILFNSCGSHAVIWGSGGIRVIQLPRRWGKFAEYEGGKSVVSCRTISVAERYCISQGGIQVQKVAWHPGSATDSHLAVLTSDNILSIFDLFEPDKALQTINMDTLHSDINISPTKISYSAALGEQAVAFDFGQPIHLQQKKKILSGPVENTKCLVWPVYLVMGNGNVCIAYTSTDQQRDMKFAVQGPLMMHPPADDNYGVDACDILCLNTSPPLLVIATCEGKLHHCLLLQSNEAESSIQYDGSISRCSSDSMLYEAIDEPALYVIESVELELSLTIPQFNTHKLVEDDFTCQVQLQKDPSTYDRYHCSHSAGVHSIGLPWAQSLNTFVTNEDEVNPTLPDNQECIVEHVICTKPLISSPASPIQGLSIVTAPALGISLLVLTTDYLFITLPLGSKYRTVSFPLASDSQSRTVTSPLRKLSRQPFDQHIAKILQRTSSNPLLSSGCKSDVSQQECFQLLSRATQVLREEYIQKQDQARIEIETRVRILKDQKVNQVEDLQRLDESRNILRDKAEGISEKIENCQHLQEVNLKRLEGIMRKIQSRLPMLSDAEKTYGKELQTMSDNIEVFKKNLQQLQKKQEYQKRRMDLGSTQTKNQPVLKSNQTTQLKEILQQESSDIEELLKRINHLKVDTSISIS